jgi:hypothetical protein
MFTAQDFDRGLLGVDPAKNMLLTGSLRHRCLDSSAASGGDDGTENRVKTTSLTVVLLIRPGSQNLWMATIILARTATMLSAAPSSEDIHPVSALPFRNWSASLMK